MANLVDNDSKALFSFGTKPRCSGGRYSFPWIASLTLDPYTTEC